MGSTVDRPASNVDYAEMLQDFIVPKAEMPYILARLALTDPTSDNIRKALFALDFAQGEGMLEPPMNQRLASEVGFLAEEIDSGRSPAGDASKVLLAWALDNEVRGLARG